MTFLFFGDSFTAGVELLDYQFYNDYPAPMSYEDKKSQHMENWRKNNKPLRQIKTKEEIDQIWEKQKLHTYAHKLAELCGIKYKNCSVGGASLQKIRYLLVKETSMNCDSDLTVFIQTTTPTRWMEYVNKEWLDFIVGNAYSEEITENYFKFKVASNTDYSMFCVWLLEIHAIYDFCTNNNKIKNFYFINSGVFNYIDRNKNTFEDLVDTYESLMPKIVKKTFHFPHTKNMQELNFLPWGHVKEDNHKELAIEIYKKIC